MSVLPDIARRGANQNVVLAGISLPLFARRVVIGKCPRRNRDRDRLRFPRIQAHFRKPFQLLDRLVDLRPRIVDIKLDHFGARPLARVRNRQGYGVPFDRKLSKREKTIFATDL